MGSKKAIIIFLSVSTLLTVRAYSQGFSDDPVKFAQQAEYVLKSKDTEAYFKVASDFSSVWNTKMRTEHKETLMDISDKMRNKGFTLQPHFRYLFSYIANAVTHHGVQADQLTEILAINQEAVETLDREEYAYFLYEMSTFFAERNLHRSKNIYTRAAGGSFSFEMIDPGGGFSQDTATVEEEPETNDGFLTEEEFQQQNIISEPEDNSASGDDWGSADDWGNDDWGSNDDWGNDDWGNDDWGSNDDWGNDSWDDSNSSPDDDWGTTPEPQQETLPEYTPVTIDYVNSVKKSYVHPQINGPVIHLRDIALEIVTPYDSLRITNVDGDHLLKDRMFAGSSGSLDWPFENERNREATITLGEFKVRVDRGDFRTPNATLSYDTLFSGETEGVFKHKSVMRRKGEYSRYPQFTSYEPDITMTFNEGKVTYSGGISLKGNKIYGECISRKRGVLTALDGNGRTATIRGYKFAFEEGVIRTGNATVSIVNGGDSIYHPNVEVSLNLDNNQMRILRMDDNDVTPYVSTYHRISINADLFTWYMDEDSMEIDILNGKDLVPATFESFDFFNKERYNRMTGILPFNPIGAFVFFSKKFNTKQFYIDEFVTEFDEDKNMALGAARVLHDYGFAKFNPATEQIILNEKAIHYYEAASKKRDYDNLLIPSIISDTANAVLNFETMDLKVNGVERFFVTQDFEIGIEPDSGSVVLQRNRNVIYNGSIDAGDYKYSGKEFEFDYGAFLIQMPEIDSIQLSPRNEEGKQDGLRNNIAETSGTLYLDRPDNKSGKEEFASYPYFVTQSESVVYFDGPEILNGAYDKSVKFVIPPMEFEKIEDPDPESFYYPGTFTSNKIFPDFQDTLVVMPDQSLGFVHNIPPSGYELYGTPARTYETIRLDNNGIMGTGKIDFLNATIYSEDFLYYPDSVTADGYKGTIEPGTTGSGSYPQAEMGHFRMYWLPRKDSMYLKTVKDPFEFYHATADLVGEANITQKGVFGSGTMLTRGSEATSSEMTFKEFSYNARHTHFKVLSDNPSKPAMAGDDIRLDFDLTNNTAVVRPEQAGVAAISFPYAQFKTSITQATWDLEDSVITMRKPEDVPIERSYFYTTREELDSLHFNGIDAVYDINTYELKIEGIPYIEVADAKIIPDNNETTILENSVLQTFHEADILIDYPEATHHLYNGTIDIFSRNKFEGSALYQLDVLSDTFEINMHTIYQETEQIGTKKKPETRTYTHAIGEVPDNQRLIISPGFLYKGSTEMKAYKQALELNGSIKPDFTSKPNHNTWITYSRVDEQPEVVIDIETHTYDDGDPIVAGLHYDQFGKIYPTFIEKHKLPGDHDLFRAKGSLFYSPDTKNYIIESPQKTAGETYAGYSFIYNDSSANIIMEGPANFFIPNANKISVEGSIVGSGDTKENEYSLDALLGIEFDLSGNALQLMVDDMLDIVTRLGLPPANNIEIETLIKLSNYIGEEVTREYETGSLKEYLPLVEMAPEMERSIMISGVKLEWNDEFNAWYNTTKLSISNVGKSDVNAKMDGFIEFKKDDTGGDMLNLFIQAAPGSWYYFSYQENSLLIHSSNSEFNEEIKSKSNYGEAKPDELVLIAGEENETLKFLNTFRKNYFGIDEPYNLVYPDDAILEDQEFETIEKDDDDGFGF